MAASTLVELGVDDIIVTVVIARGTTGGGVLARASGGGGTLLGGQSGEDLLEFGGQWPHALHARLFLDRRPGIGDEHLGPRPLVRGGRVAQFGQALLDLVRDGVELVAGVDGFAQLPVLTLVALGLLHHALDLTAVQVGAFADGDALFLAGVPVARRDIEDAVGVDVEGDLDLRFTSRQPAGCR